MGKEIVIIGGGPGGYTAAIRAAQLGAKVTLIEKDKLGGTCLNRGCIPTKAFYHSAQILDEMKRVDDFGVNISGLSWDFSRMQERKNKIVAQLVTGVEKLLKANKIEVLYGNASFLDDNSIVVAKEDGAQNIIKAHNILIASGSLPSIPPIFGIDLPGVITSEEILDLDEIPKRLVIIGGGVIGVEYAGIFNSLGSEVEVVEYMPQILPAIDRDISTRLNAMLKRKGIGINTGAVVKKIQKDGEGFRVIVEGKKGELMLDADKVLVSTGRQANIQGLNLNHTSIVYDQKGIKVDDSYATNVEGIYAIGDVTGGQMLAHVAAEEGTAVVERIFGREREKPMCVAACVFSFPEIAAVGMTEEEVSSKGLEYKTSKFLFGANGKALTMNKGEGFVKVIADEKGSILGVHIMGPHASDLIHEAALAIENGLGVKDVIKTVHAHPTLAESFHEAVLGLEKRAIHMIAR